MGMYTELVCAFELKKDTPKEIVDILKYMVDEGEEPVENPNHPLFETDRWHFMLTSNSYYFDGDTTSTVRKDHIAETIVTIRCNLKNYDDEIEKFIDWIKPYSNTRGFIGYKRYEQDEHPELIYI